MSRFSTLVYVSGQIADGDGWEDQARGVFRTSAPRSRPAAQPGTTFQADDLRGRRAARSRTIRRVRDEFIDVSAPPTSSLVRVAGLVRPELLLEVEAVAAV